MAQSITDKARKDAQNGTYNPPTTGQDYELQLYDRVWDMYTQQSKGL